MKALKLSEDVLPIGEFKTNASRVIRRLRSDQRPVVITQNGRPAAVLIAPEDYDRLQELARFEDAVREGLRDSDVGRVVDDETVGRDLAAAFGSSIK